MLSNSAFNALLKTLEEPPSHVIFILATTEVQKLPQTIVSRCQRFDFKRISKRDLEIRFREILHAEGINCDEKTLDYVCTAADGSVRDGLSILDKVIASCPGDIHYEEACRALGVSSFDLKIFLTEAIAEHDIGKILDVMHKVQTEGVSRETFLNDMLAHFRDMIIVKESKDASEILEYDKDHLESLLTLSSSFTTEQLLYAIDALAEALAEAKYAKNSAALFEVALIKIARADVNQSPKALLARIDALEEAILGQRSFASTQEIDRQSGGDFVQKVAKPIPKIEENPITIEQMVSPVPPSSELPWEDSPLPDEPNWQQPLPLETSREAVASPPIESRAAAKPVKAEEIEDLKALVSTPVPIPKQNNGGAAVAIDKTLDWPGFLAKIRGKNSSLFGLLSESKGFLGQNGVLYVVFKDEDAFLKTVVSTPANRSTLTDLAKEKLGLAVEVQTELASSFAKLSVDESGAVSPNKFSKPPTIPEKKQVNKEASQIAKIANKERISSMAKIPAEEIPFDIGDTKKQDENLTVQEKINQLAKKFPDIIEKNE